MRTDASMRTLSMLSRRTRQRFQSAVTQSVRSRSIAAPAAARLFEPQTPFGFFALGCGVAAATLAANASNMSETEGTANNSSLPTYTLKEVAEHDGKKSDRVWVTHGDGVYDITDFIKSHPGGASKISLAAGKSLEPFWHLFPFHNEQTQVADYLKSMRIGTLDAADVAAAAAEAAAASASGDPFNQDPPRHPALQMHSRKPCNAEVPADLLTDNYLTPVDLWYIRHHHPVPQVDPDAYRLVVDATAGGGRKLELTLADLASLPQHEVVATMQCSGNRRKDMSSVAPTSGTSWYQGAISTASFRGPAVRELLALAGFNPHSIGVDKNNQSSADAAAAKATAESVKHCCFKGLDGMAASIILNKALNPYGDTILALTMNGEPLPRDHGYPVRSVAPGTVGVRNVKWVSEVAVSPQEAVGDWQRGLNYKILPPSKKSAQGVDLSKLPAMQDASVFSGITSVSADAASGSSNSSTSTSNDTNASSSSLPPNDGTVDVKGWAWAGGGRGIARVDISTDGGAHWHPAELTEGTSQPLGREWAWVFFEASDVPHQASDGQSLEVISRAVDKCYNVQPEHANHIWNIRGLGNNSWFRRSVNIEKD